MTDRDFKVVCEKVIGYCYKNLSDTCAKCGLDWTSMVSLATIYETLKEYESVQELFKGSEKNGRFKIIFDDVMENIVKSSAIETIRENWQKTEGISKETFEEMSKMTIKTFFSENLEILKKNGRRLSFETSFETFLTEMKEGRIESLSIVEIYKDIRRELLFIKLFTEHALEILGEEKEEAEEKSRIDFERLCQKTYIESIMRSMYPTLKFDSKSKSQIDEEMRNHENYPLIQAEIEKNEKYSFILKGISTNILLDFGSEKTEMSKHEFIAFCNELVKECASQTIEKLDAIDINQIDRDKVKNFFLEALHCNENVIKLSNAINNNSEYMDIYTRVASVHIRKLSERVAKKMEEEKMKDKKRERRRLNKKKRHDLKSNNQPEEKEVIEEETKNDECAECSKNEKSAQESMEKIKELENQLIEEREKCKRLRKEKENLEIKLKSSEAMREKSETKMTENLKKEKDNAKVLAENLRIEKERLRKSNEEKKKWEKCEQDLKKEKEKSEKLKKEMTNLEMKMEKSEKAMAESLKKEKEISKKLANELAAEKENRQNIAENLEMEKENLEKMRNKNENYVDSLELYKSELEKSERLVENFQQKRENEKKEKEEMASKISAMEEFQKINNKETEEWKAQIMKMFEKQAEELKITKQELKKYEARK